MPREDVIEAEYTLRRDRLSGGVWPSRGPHDGDREMLVAFLLYALLNLAAAALGLLIWIV